MTAQVNNAPCSLCIGWCAASRDLLEHRKRQVAKYPEMKFHACPQCGSTAWGLSEVRLPVKEDQEGKAMAGFGRQIGIAVGIAAIAVLMASLFAFK